MIHHMSVDLETYSSEPIAKVGLYKYVQSPDFEILLFACSLDGGPVQQYDLTENPILPEQVVVSLFMPDYIKHAYNAAFEWYCLSKYFHLPNPTSWLHTWRDTMLHALYCGYPMSLDNVGKAIGLPEDKRKLSTGKALIKTFCTPQTPTARDPRTRIRPADEPEKWNLFKTYNRQDVATEMEIESRLSPFPVPNQVQKQWETDLKINSRGVALDMDLIRGALECSQAVTDPLMAEAQKLTGLDNPNSLMQVKNWLQDSGHDVNTLRKDDVETMLGNDDLDDDTRRVLEIRQELGKTSNKKYVAMQTAVCSDERIRGTLQFYGANRTGRYSGRIIQPQNLPRTNLHGGMLDLARELTKARKTDTIRLIYGSVPDTLSQLIRTALVPSPGNLFVDADFSAIEARVIAWLAGEEWVLNVFRSHGKIYEATASQMFGVPIEKITKGQPEYELRQKGKVATLALGYQGSVGSLIAMGALKMGLTEEELPEIVQRWRDSNRRICDLWYATENAAINVVQTGRPAGVRGLLFALEGDHETGQYFLTITLPSGRKLYYAQPTLGTNQWGRPSIRYMDVAQTSHKWEPTETYGGKLVENITQAIARDCLAESIERLEEAGYEVVFHVHDEIVCDVPADRADLENVIRIMSKPIRWAPGLPLAADGWAGDYYKKE